MKPASPTIVVLLVDDNAFARSVGMRALRAAGVEAVTEAASGREALELLISEAIDVVFCDLMMPDMDGVQLIRHIAELGATPAFVFVSAADLALLNAAQDTAKARGFRVLGAVQKPLTAAVVSRLLAHVDKVVSADTVQKPFAVSVSDLQQALADNQFELAYQPKIQLSNRALVGFEALVRWRHPAAGVIAPGAFIGMAEQGGMIGPLTDRITTLALRQCAAWSAQGLRAKISINLSAFMLVDLDLPDRIAQETADLGVDPHQIILEITESGMIQDEGNSLEILARLHMKGFALSIDDFGTGYSSMEQLRRIPFSELKIDRAFVTGAHDSVKARAILESSAHLGRRLKVNVVAEGAESEDDIGLLRRLGIDIAQGYTIAKPMSANAVPEWSRDWAQRTQS